MARENSRNPHMQGMRTARTLLIVAVLCLVAIGLVMVYSTTSVVLAGAGSSPYSDVISQAVFAGIGIAAAIVIWRVIPYNAWAGQFTWIAWGIAIALLFLTWIAGTEVNGAKRWLYIGPIGMQPSELIKIAMLLMVIRIMNDVRQANIEVRAAIVQFFLLILLPIVLLYATQSDLGTTLICAVGIFAVLWIGGISGKWLLGIGIVGLIAAAYAIFGTGFRSGRLVYLDPWGDGQNGYGTGYNIIRSYYALSEGGLFGVGIGNSHEKYDYLFASESDFIFAVIGEETGLVGALVVVTLFLVVLYAGLKISEGAPDELGAMIAGGFAIMLVFQAFLNIGCTIGVFPTTGKPLPFISSGGTSIVASLLMVGLMLSVERGAERPDSHERIRQEFRVHRGGASGIYDDSYGVDGLGSSGFGSGSRSRSRGRGSGDSGSLGGYGSDGFGGPSGSGSLGGGADRWRRR